MATKRRFMGNIGKGKLGQVSGALTSRKAPNPRVAKSLRKVGQILMAYPEKAGQVSAETLSQIDTSADKTGQLGITVKRALPGALAREATKTDVTARKPRRKKGSF